GALSRERIRFISSGRSDARARRTRQALLSRHKKRPPAGARHAARFGQAIARHSRTRRRSIMKTPPVLATKLLERLTPSSYSEALAGDLIEQYRHGRSTAWFWRQTLLGVIAGVAKDIWNHKPRAVISLVLGCAIYLLSSIPVNLLIMVLSARGLLPYRGLVT